MEELSEIEKLKLAKKRVEKLKMLSAKLNKKKKSPKKTSTKKAPKSFLIDNDCFGKMLPGVE